MNKLEGFPTVHYITLRESVDRRTKLENWFNSYDINYIPHIFDRVKNLERYDFSHTFPNMVKPIFISHLLLFVIGILILMRNIQLYVRMIF